MKFPVEVSWREGRGNVDRQQTCRDEGEYNRLIRSLKKQGLRWRKTAVNHHSRSKNRGSSYRNHPRVRH